MTDQLDYRGWTHDLWECCCSEGTARWKPHGDKDDPTLAHIEVGGPAAVTPVRFCSSHETRLHDEWIYQFRPLPLPLAQDNWTHQVFQCPKFVEPEHEVPSNGIPLGVNRRPIGTPDRRAKGPPLLEVSLFGEEAFLHPGFPLGERRAQWQSALAEGHHDSGAQRC